ncbi:hypothetical protein D9M68_964490 [compost metagenome]
MSGTIPEQVVVTAAIGLVFKLAIRACYYIPAIFIFREGIEYRTLEGMLNRNGSFLLGIEVDSGF